MEHQKVPMAEAMATRLREASRRFGERSTALSEADIDLAAVARKAYRRAQFEQEASDSQMVVDDETSSRRALSGAAALIESEARADIRLGMQSDLLLGIVPAVLLIGALAAIAWAFDTVITLRLVAVIGAVLMMVAVAAVAVASGFISAKLNGPIHALGRNRMLATSGGALVAGIFLFVVSGVALSQYTKDRRVAVRFATAKDLNLIDSSVQLTLAAQQAGMEPKAALELAGQATGVDWRLESSQPNARGFLLAKASLSKAEAVVTYPLTDSLSTLPRLAQTQLVSDKGRLLGESTYLIGTVAEQPPLSGGVVKLALRSSGSTRTYSFPQGLLIPPPGTPVVASIRGEEVVLIQPIDWLAARVRNVAVANASAAALSYSSTASAASK